MDLYTVNYKKAEQLQDLGRFDQAITLYTKALQYAPNDKYAKQNIGICYINAKKHREAKHYCYRVLQKEYPDSHFTQYLLALVNYNINRLAQAKLYIQKAIALDPSKVYLYVLKADILFNQKKYRKALTSVNTALEISANDTDALNARAKILSRLGKKSEAFTSIEQSLKENPEEFDSHVTAGLTNLETGNHKKAKEHFISALRLNPTEEGVKDGLIEAIKSKNIFYRWYLRFELWKASKGLFQKIVFYFLFISSMIALYYLSTLLPKFGEVIMVALIGVVLVYLFRDWFMPQFGDFIATLDTDGRRILPKRNVASGVSFALLALIGVLCILVYLLLPYKLILGTGVTSLLLLLPVSLAITSKNGYFLFVNIMVILLISLSAYLAIVQKDMVFLFLNLLVFVGYTWAYAIGSWFVKA